MAIVLGLIAIFVSIVMFFKHRLMKRQHLCELETDPTLEWSDFKGRWNSSARRRVREEEEEEERQAEEASAARRAQREERRNQKLQDKLQKKMAKGENSQGSDSILM